MALCCALALPLMLAARPAIAAPTGLQATATPAPTATPPAPLPLDWSQTAPQVAGQIGGAAGQLTPTNPLGLVLLGILVLQLSTVLIRGAIQLIHRRRAL